MGKTRQLFYKNYEKAVANGANFYDGFSRKVVENTAKKSNFAYAEKESMNFSSDIISSGIIFEFLLHLKITSNTKIL